MTPSKHKFKMTAAAVALIGSVAAAASLQGSATAAGEDGALAVLELTHVPPVVIEPGAPSSLTFRALCVPRRGAGALDHSLADVSCKGAALRVRAWTEDGNVVALTALPTDEESVWALAVPPLKVGLLSYDAELEWQGRRATDRADAVIAEARPVLGNASALARRERGRNLIRAPWSSAGLRPKFVGGTGVGPTGWTPMPDGGHLLIDPATDSLVEMDSEGNVIRRNFAHVAGSTVTGLAAISSDRGTSASAIALVLSQDARGARVVAVALDSGNVRATLTLPTHRKAGALIPSSGGAIDIVTYPGPQTQRLELNGDVMTLGEPGVDRPLVGSDGRIRVAVNDGGSVYCTSKPETLCFELGREELGGYTPAEVTFAGTAADGATIIVQKVFNDNDDFYIVLRAQHGRMSVVRTLPSASAYELPLGARFALDEQRRNLIRLETTVDALSVTSTPLENAA